jgi:hypothetical protein
MTTELQQRLEEPTTNLSDGEKLLSEYLIVSNKIKDLEAIKEDIKAQIKDMVLEDGEVVEYGNAVARVSVTTKTTHSVADMLKAGVLTQEMIAPYAKTTTVKALHIGTKE